MGDRAARLRAGMPLLTPLAWLYRGGLALARATGSARREAHPGARVVSVGNLEVGGSGKTPLAMLVLEAAIAGGQRVAYVTRGYGSRAERGPLVSLVLPTEEPPVDGLAGARVIDRGGPVDLADALGDETALVAERVPGAVVVAGAGKTDAVRAAIALGATLVVVDDAFQSWRLARDVDVVLLDARRPLGPGKLLPAGSLREGPGALRRADAIVFNGAGDADAIAAATRQIQRWIRPGTPVLGMTRTPSLMPVVPSSEARPARALVVAGIARPDRLREDVTTLGVVVAGERWFRDHHRYGASDVENIHAAAAAARADALLVTEKDWVKLRRFVWALPVWKVRLDVALTEDSLGPLLFPHE
ncbi:MAG TPA: tetraacyldisaccharide 4'-kinase [Candidatus Krumholzibacteria bacterium]|nr:tetraacyldisaccharide 4'-kinase [Candidatus Krumholzibacteria bacterium]